MDTELKTLYDERNKALKDAHDLVRTANEAGEVLTQEQRDQVSKLNDSATKAEELIEQRNLANSISERRDSEKADEERRRFNIGPEQREQEDSENQERSDNLRNWFRGDTSVYGKEIHFNLNDVVHSKRASNGATQKTYREVSPGEFRALSVGTDSAGGATVPTPFLNQLYDFRETYSTFRALMPEVLTTDSGADFELPIVTAHGQAANAGNPPAALAENTAIGGTDPTFDKIVLKAFKAGQVVGLSNEMIMDNGVNVESWLAKDLGRAVARIEDAWFYNGSGTNMPQGIVNGGFGTARVGTALNGSGGSAPAKIEYQDLTSVIAGLDDSYGAFNTPTPQMADTSSSPALKWVMDKSTLAQVWLTEDNNGQFVFQPYLAQGLHSQIFGHPFVTAPQLPDFTRGANVLYFGAWAEAVVLRDVGVVTLAYSDDAGFKEDQRVYRITCRVDSRIRDARAATQFRTRAS